MRNFGNVVWEVGGVSRAGLALVHYFLSEEWGESRGDQPALAHHLTQSSFSVPTVAPASEFRLVETVYTRSLCDTCFLLSCQLEELCFGDSVQQRPSQFLAGQIVRVTG